MMPNEHTGRTAEVRAYVVIGFAYSGVLLYVGGDVDVMDDATDVVIAIVP